MSSLDETPVDFGGIVPNECVGCVLDPLSCGLLCCTRQARRMGSGDRARRVVSMNKVRGLVISCCEG